MYILSGFTIIVYFLLRKLLSGRARKAYLFSWRVIFLYETMRIGYRLIVFGKL